MGQNQDKLGEGEQAVGEGLNEMRPSPDSGGACSHSCDVMEGGSSCEEEAGNTRGNSGKPDTQDLDGSLSQEPTSPSSEKNINLWVSPFVAKEVRQGGAAGKEGGGGGRGGRTAPLVPQETDKNQESSAKIEERAGAHNLFNQIKTEENNTKEDSDTSSKIKMDYQDKGSVQYVEIQDQNFSAGVVNERSGTAVNAEDANSLKNTTEDSVMVKMSRCGAHAGRELLLSFQQDQHDTIMAEVEDIKLCEGTVGCLIEKKEPPTAQRQHPLKNSLQKESLSGMSDTIHCRPPKERAENDKKEEICDVWNDYSSKKPKVTDTADQKESVRPYLTMETAETTTNQKIDSCSTLNPAFEPRSILEKLLERNRKETTPALKKIEEVDTNDKNTMDIAAKRILGSAATELATNQIDQSDVNTPSACDMKRLNEKQPKENHATRGHHIRDVDVKQAAAVDSMTSNSFQPEVIENTMCESLLTKSQCSKAYCLKAEENINSTDASVNEDVEIKPNMTPFKNLFKDNLQSAVSHESTSREVSSLIAEESASLSVFDVKSSPTKSDGQVADSCYLVTDEKTETSTIRPPLQIKSDSECKADPQLSGSACFDAQSVKRKKVKTSTEDTAASAVNAGSILVAAGTVIPEVGHQITRPDLDMSLNTENMMPDQPDEQLGSEGNDSVSLRDKSQSNPKSGPVSELIKETIQLHEKLQHQDRTKSAEIKMDEQGQSVKVAQMKAAFDSAQKSPDKAVERKPSVRRGSSLYCDCEVDERKTHYGLTQ
ncbi:uncharacterized protein si:ch211-108c6.2 [Etheostoma cragini]|uniref:uncharacterized protein si:ch211-108c6.2 n=1 Tax=Etheostoma cragini TaxID=417921 RepID=UPI00155F295F|nr:uncharacterized protein si:ch211-108c6.2 [Etheostoma cragini]